jgi:hypothetical protein
MIHSNLRVDVHDPLHSCCIARHLLQSEIEYGPEDPEATITSNEFRTLAWAAANEKARCLGWIRSCDEIHEAVKLAAESRDAV